MGWASNSNDVTIPKFPPPQTPKQIGVFAGARLDLLSSHGDHLGRAQAVDSQAVLATQPAEASTEGQPGYSRCGVDAHRDGETMGLRRGVQFTEGDARLNADQAFLGVYIDLLHR